MLFNLLYICYSSPIKLIQQVGIRDSEATCAYFAEHMGFKPKKFYTRPDALNFLRLLPLRMQKLES